MRAILMASVVAGNDGDGEESAAETDADLWPAADPKLPLLLEEAPGGQNTGVGWKLDENLDVEGVEPQSWVLVPKMVPASLYSSALGM